jgi:hypothetical protein
MDPEAGQPNRTDKFFRLTVSPYCGLQTAGLYWDFKARFNLIKSSLDPFMEFLVGIKARF